MLDFAKNCSQPLAVFMLMYSSLSISVSARAEKAVQRKAILAHAGRAVFSGGLSGNNSARVWGLEVIVPDSTISDSSFSKTMCGLGSFLSADFTQSEARTRMDLSFPFNPGNDVNIGQSAVLGNFCALRSLPVQVCLGAGITLINVSDFDNSQTYGASRADFRLGRYLMEGLNGGVEVSYFKVQQKLSGKASTFSQTSYQAALGWQW